MARRINDILIVDAGQYLNINALFGGSCGDVQAGMLRASIGEGGLSVFQNYPNGGSGEKLKAKVKITGQGTDVSETAIYLEEAWEDGYEPTWAPDPGSAGASSGYWFLGSQQAVEENIALVVKGEWDDSHDPEYEMDQNWAKQIAQAYTQSLTSDIKLERINREARKQLKKGTPPLDAGDLLWTCKSFCIETLKRLLGVKNTQAPYEYTLKSKIKYSPYLITTNKKACIKYKLKYQTSTGPVEEEGRASGLLVYRVSDSATDVSISGIGTANPVEPTLSIVVENTIDAGDYTQITAEVFGSNDGDYPNSAFANWTNNELKNYVENYQSNVPPVVFDSSNLKMKAQIDPVQKDLIRFTGKCTWGTDANGSLWLGNFMFSLSFGAAGFLSSVIQMYNNYRAMQKVKAQQAKQTAQQVVQQAAAGLPATATSNLNINGSAPTQTSEPTRTSDGPAKDASNSANNSEQQQRQSDQVSDSI